LSEVLNKIAKSIEELDGKEAEKLVRKALDEGVDPVKPYVQQKLLYRCNSLLDYGTASC
jgi:methanogenic corrinoid protein MtbC1